MIDRVKAFWASLPHQIQAGVVAFLCAFGAAASQKFAEPNTCYSLTCLWRYLPTFLSAGVIGVKLFYMQPAIVAGKPASIPADDRVAK